MKANSCETSKQIERLKNSIITSWLHRATESIDASKAQSKIQLIDSLPAFLDDLIEALACTNRSPEVEIKSNISKEHGDHRAARPGYTLDKVIYEFHLLRSVIIETLTAEGPCDDESLALIHKFIDIGIMNAAVEFSEVHERKLIEKHTSEALTEKDNLVRLFDAYPSPNVLWRTRDLIYERVSPSYQALFPRKQLIGKPFLEAVPEPEYLPFFEIIRGVFDTGTPVTLKEQLVYFDIDGKGMKERYYTLSFFQIKDAEGKPYGVYQQAEDNTEQIFARRKIEESEKLLRESQEQLQFALESAMMGTWHIDLKTNIVTTSKGVAKIWGIDEINANVFDVIARQMHPDDQEATNRAWTTAVANKTSYYAEYRVIRPDGKVAWGFSKGEPQYDAEGNAVALMGILGDITERKAIEAQLAFERHKLETIFQETPAAMALWRGEEFVFEKVNPQYQDIFPERELVGKPFLEACPEFIGLPFIDYLRDVLRTGKPYIGVEEYAPIRLQDGRIEDRYYDFTYQRINDANGKPYGVYDHAIDVTDRVKARKAVEFEQLKLKTVVENSTASIAVLRGKNFTYELTNKSYSELFSNRDLIGKPLLEALPELANQPFPKHAKSVLETGVPYVESEALAWLKRTESGPLEERYFDQTYSRILDYDGKPYGIFMHAQEVTERVLARRKLEDALQARDEFLSIASHELKTPLTSLKIQAQLHKRMITKKDPGAYAPEKIDEIVNLTDKQVSRLNRLVDDMLDVSRIRTGNLNFTLDQFDLGDLVEEVIQRLQGQFESSSTPLPKLTQKEPSLGKWDRLRLEQVITNLLMNALRYGNRKPINVFVESKRNLVKLTVLDHGIGIADDSKERIFNRFERSVNSSEVSGLGLGLFITKQIVAAHKGKIWVESELGKGSRFIVELPN